MRLLIDTHILLWWLGDDPALPPWAASAIADPEHDVIVSAASVWEISIKQAAGRLPAHHADPFDRILIAQAGLEGLTLVSVDRRFADYDVALLGAA